jgi:hypothetical protein
MNIHTADRHILYWTSNYQSLMYYVLITNKEIKIYNFILFISSSVSLVLSYTLKSTIVNSVYIPTIFRNVLRIFSPKFLYP